jgi:hypothetical protein
MRGNLELLALLGGDIPREAVAITMAFFAMITIISLGVPLIRLITRRLERKPLPPSQASADVTARLERIEQAVEAVAIEVERIAESQRFSAKLMAEREKPKLPGGEK